MLFKRFLKKPDATRQPRLMEGQEQYLFRRSRTLTGTTSAKVVTSAERRGQLKTARLKLHELRSKRLHLLRYFGMILAVSGLIVYLVAVFITSPQIGFAQASQNQPSSPVYVDSLGQYLADNPLERFSFALNDEKIESYLKKAHPEVRSLAIAKNWYGGEIKFNIYFREPLLVWQTGNQRFYVDSQGVAFTYNHFAEPTVVVTDQSGISPDTASGSVASTRFVGFLGRMVGAVNGYGKGRVVAVSLPASTREIDLKLEGRDYPIKTHIDRDPLEQAEDIKNVLAYFDQKSIKPQYIDVRVSGKAFYK